MEILSPFTKTNSGNQPARDLTNRYTKPTRAIPATTVTFTSAATVSINNWIIFYCIPRYVLTDKELEFVGKLFATIIARLVTKPLTTTVYHTPSLINSHIQMSAVADTGTSTSNCWHTLTIHRHTNRPARRYTVLYRWHDGRGTPTELLQPIIRQLGVLCQRMYAKRTKLWAPYKAASTVLPNERYDTTIDKTSSVTDCQLKYLNQNAWRTQCWLIYCWSPSGCCE